MPIKFPCPHCKRVMTAPDSLAGKKGRCKACQQVLTVPKPANAKPNAPGPSSAAPSAPPAAPKNAPPPTPSADVESEAAALFADEPKTEEPAEVKTIDLNCPYCDEAIQFSADLAGKRAPCPECKHIIKVPELVKKEPKDWRKADRRGPAGARLPDQPALEGAWGSAEAGKVGRDTLQKVGVIPTVKPPRTFWQKVRWPLVGVSAVILLAGLSWGGYLWWGRHTIERLLGDALAYAAAPEPKPKAGQAELFQAELFLGAGKFELNRKTSKSATEARKYFGNASTRLQSAPSGSERDAALADLALALIDLAGGPPETDNGLRLPWNDVQRLLFNVLSNISKPDARRETFRVLSQRLIKRGETQRLLSLLGQVYSAPDDEKAAALCVVALELYQAKDKEKAQKAVEDALKLYEVKKPPPVRAEVVAMGRLLLKDKAPKLPEEAKDDQKANERVGQVEALARSESWDEARKKADGSDGDTKFRALLAIAAAAVDHTSADAGNDVEAAANAIEKANQPELSWSLLRLTELALRAGLPEERIQSLAGSIADKSLRGRAQLAIFRDRLAKSQQPVEESALDKIDASTLSRALAVEDLARHNTSLDKGWAKHIQGWEQPRKAFGSLGAALGMQDRSRK